MMRTQDRPGLEERLLGLRASLLADIPVLREAQFRIGRTLLSLRRAGDLTPLGVTTFPMLCEAAGLSPVEGRELTGMVEAAEARPEVESRVLEAKVSPQKAALVNEVLRDPALQRPGEDPLALAERKSSRDFREWLDRRRAEARVPGPPVARTFHFSAEENRDVNRTQELVGRMRGRLVTDSEAVATACGEFVDRHDPERRAGRLEARDATVGAGAARPRRAMGSACSRHSSIAGGLRPPLHGPIVAAPHPATVCRGGRSPPASCVRVFVLRGRPPAAPTGSHRSGYEAPHGV